MPRTRPHLERDAKVDELVAAAVRRLKDGGYAQLSIADIARELGLAQNAVYWYFPSKDHLFVAALQQIVDDVLSRKAKASSTVARILWFADRVHEFQALRLALHDRAAASEVAAEFEVTVTSGLRMLLSGALEGSVDRERLELTVDAVVALIEGALLQGYPRRRRAEVIRHGLERLTGLSD